MPNPFEAKFAPFISVIDMNASTPESSAFDDESDTLLLRGIANGNRDSFRRLYERYSRHLYSAIFQVLNQAEDTEEVLQETLFALWRKAGLYEASRGRPVTWLTSLARNRAIDRLRANRRRHRLRSSLEESGETADPQKPHLDGRALAMRREQCETVWNAIIELTDIQRQAIEMAYFDGLSQDEIARRLGEPIGTVKARIRRGVGRLRRVILARN